MRRIIVMAAAAVSVLALSAAPAAASAVPQPTVVRTSTTVANELRVLTPERVAAAWDCQAGYSCYYTGLNGTGYRWRAPGCGWWYLDGTLLQNNLYSIDNRGSGRVDVYNRIGANSYELKGWVYPGQQGNFHQNIGADVVDIYC
ncbi:peptidase inhibitor family I36 protein [Actinomadura fibrosa]|uniref:Peptidase inhibitor family I36 protein n=1 Tax=Actinomadura fibrosa TaxID=111802 RepID=A0ABW2Y2H0_9ACTN|nr:peptidase inhibitor family I36 protein [Actinomadura fibrosa]